MDKIYVQSEDSGIFSCRDCKLLMPAHEHWCVNHPINIALNRIADILDGIGDLIFDKQETELMNKSKGN